MTERWTFLRVDDANGEPVAVRIILEDAANPKIVRAVATDVGLEHDQAETTVWAEIARPVAPHSVRLT